MTAWSAKAQIIMTCNAEILVCGFRPNCRREVALAASKQLHKVERCLKNQVLLVHLRAARVRKRLSDRQMSLPMSRCLPKLSHKMMPLLERNAAGLLSQDLLCRPQSLKEVQRREEV